MDRPPPPKRSPDSSASLRGVAPAADAIDTSSFESPWVLLRSFSSNPLIFQRMVRRSDPAARPGQVVSVYDKSGGFCGRALFNPRSQVELRMLTGPNGPPIDDAFWRARLASAIELRQRLRIAEATDAYRLVHAEGDELSGLIMERMGDCLVLEIFSLGMFERSAYLAEITASLLGQPLCLDRPQKSADAWRVVVRADARIERIEGFQTPPPAADAARNLVIREHGVRYRVDVSSGHKTGFFCDQRDNRRRFATLCRDLDVLDVCCYSGGFALCAKLLGGARNVTAVDLDESALLLARENANLNQTRIDFVHSDGFIFMRQMLANSRRFGAVVLDPPKFAPSREDYEDALAKYYDLNVLGAQLVQPGGFLLTCSCSGLIARDVFLETVLRAVRRTGRQAQLLEYSGAAPDHPIASNCPETAYLKALFLRIL